MRKLIWWLCALTLSCTTVAAAPQDALQHAQPNSPIVSSATAPTPALEDSATQSATASSTAPQRDENGFYIGGPVYVSTSNQVWTRSGPGTNYRITGSRAIGTELTFIAYSRDKSFMQVEDADGNRFWMGTKTLQAESCGPAREQELLTRIRELEQELANYDSALKREVDSLAKKNARLESENSGMQQAITQKDKTIEELDELRRDYEDRLQTKELDMQMRWWVQGAVIAFCGALAGIIFIYLPRPSRKSKRDRF